MAERPIPEPSSATEACSRLHAIAQQLRHAHHLTPEAQRELAGLLDELSSALAAPSVPPAEKAHIAESAAHLMHALNEQRDEGFLGAARERFDRTVLVAETRNPFVAGVARRLLDALANLGI